MEYLIKNALVNGKLSEIPVKDGKIVTKDLLSGDFNIIDVQGLTLRPGLVDIHSHGNLGYDTMEGGLHEMSAYEFNHGITSWFPTTMTMPIEEIKKATSIIPKRNDGEAKIVGFHMEGPFIADKYKGAQNPDYIMNPSTEVLDILPHVSLVTIAPELENSEEFIRYASQKGVRVCLGHSEANYDIGKEAFSWGASCLTHTCNAMSPFLHRDPGLIGAALTENAYAQVISDGIHIHPAMVMGLYRMFGPEKMVLISDSIRATGLGDGDYVFGGQKMLVRNHVARIEAGNIAGSTSNLFDCVRSAISMGIPENDAFRMASQTPSEMMGLKKGKIDIGYDAEFIVLNKNGSLNQTLILE